MARYSKNRHTASDEIKEDAMNAAKANQRPGQAPAQTKLVAQGIQKGIDHYQKQLKAKARELDRQRKKAICFAADKRTGFV